MASVPPLIRCIQRSSCTYNPVYRSQYYRYSMLVLTFFCYMCYHICRKPLSIVKGALHQNCSALNPLEYNHWWGSHSASISLSLAPEPPTANLQLANKSGNGTWCDFAPFDKTDYKSLFGDLDYAFLITYAVGMFFSGIIAERVSIRYYLTAGMLLSGLFTSMFGLGYFFKIHSFTFYVFAQVLNGAVQTTGWPGVVTCVGNWFGKQKRGLIMGIWNSHTSFGNIIGSVIASGYVSWAWGYSFVVPGIIIGCVGIVTFFTLIDKPEDVNVFDVDHKDNPYHSIPDDEESKPDDSQKRNTVKYNSLEDEANENVNVSVNGDAHHGQQPEAIGFCGALKIPGVIEFSLCLLFAKLVSYTFLFWLPFYLQSTSTLSTKNSGLMSTLFDVGGIFGGIAAGLFSDRIGGRATTCGIMLIIGSIMMYLFNTFGTVSTDISIVLLLITGAFVNGPYALITTAVSADLGTHPVLQGNAKALSTVTAIIDGTGSIGAAIGPFLTGVISPTGWKNVFYMLIASNLLALALLSRLIFKEFSSWCKRPGAETAFGSREVRINESEQRLLG